MLTWSVDIIGVASEQSILDDGRESNLNLGRNRLRAGFTEDSAVPSRHDDAVYRSHQAPRSAASRIYFKEGKARMQVKYREFRIKVSRTTRDSSACKNVPVLLAARQFG